MGRRTDLAGRSCRVRAAGPLHHLGRHPVVADEDFLRGVQPPILRVLHHVELVHVGRHLVRVVDLEDSRTGIIINKADSLTRQVVCPVPDGLDPVLLIPQDVPVGPRQVHETRLVAVGVIAEGAAAYLGWSVGLEALVLVGPIVGQGVVRHPAGPAAVHLRRLVLFRDVVVHVVAHGQTIPVRLALARGGVKHARVGAVGLRQAVEAVVPEGLAHRTREAVGLGGHVVG